MATRHGIVLLALALTALTGCGASTGEDAAPDVPIDGGSADDGPTEREEPDAGPAESVALLPDLEVEDFEGTLLNLTELTGTPMVVNFWASWCPPCIAEMPDLEEVHQLADDSVGFVGVNTQDSNDRASELVEETGVNYRLLRDPDGELFRAFEVFAMPTTFYVDASGEIVASHAGLLTRQALIDDLDEHLGVEVAVGS